MKRKIIIMSIVLLVIVAVSSVFLVKKFNDTSLEHKLDLAHKYLKNGQYEEAVLTFEEIIEIDDAILKAYFGLAEAAEALGDFEKAEEALLAYIERDDNEEDVYELLGSVLEQGGRYEEAAEAYKHGAVLDHMDYDLISSAVNMYLKYGDVSNAIELLDQAIQEEKDDEDLYLKLAEVYMEYDKTDESKEILRMAVMNLKSTLAEEQLIELEAMEDEDNELGVVDSAEEMFDELPDYDLSDILFDLEVSSTLKEIVQGNEKTYLPTNMFDGDYSTIWSEASDGNGVGEWIKISSEESFDIELVALTNGFVRDNEIYYKNNRLKKMTLQSDKGDKAILEFDDGLLDYQTFDVDFLGVNKLTLTIEEVYEGSRYNDLCISEVMINNQALTLDELNTNIVDQISNDSFFDDLIVSIDTGLNSVDYTELRNHYDMKGQESMGNSGLMRDIYIKHYDGTMVNEFVWKTDSWYDEIYWCSEDQRLIGTSSGSTEGSAETLYVYDGRLFAVRKWTAETQSETLLKFYQGSVLNNPYGEFASFDSSWVQDAYLSLEAN